MVYARKSSVCQTLVSFANVIVDILKPHNANTSYLLLRHIATSKAMKTRAN